jgi:hypothetical protein
VGVVSALVILRFAGGMPADYVPELRDGMLVHFFDLELLSLHPTHPVATLPTGRRERVGSEDFEVFEVSTLGYQAHPVALTFESVDRAPKAGLRSPRGPRRPAVSRWNPTR